MTSRRPRPQGRTRRAALAALALIPAAPAPDAHAQAMPPTPQFMCQMATQAVQQGGPMLYTVFGQQLTAMMLQQTGGTGVYLPVVNLGPITNIMIGNAYTLPNGTFVSCRVFQVNGFSDWQIGFSPYTQRIENGVVVPYWTAAQQMPQQVQPQPAQPQPTAPYQPPLQAPAGKSEPKAPPAPTQSEACKKFPNLC